jgi:hypothetical protein
MVKHSSNRFARVSEQEPKRMMGKRKIEESGKLSPRRSILVWTVGILIGWGAAFILIVQLIKTSVSDGQTANSTQVVSSPAKKPDSTGRVEDIEPAAGPGDDQSRKSLKLP